MFGTLLPKQYGGHPVTELKKEHIYISRRGNSPRFAPHFYVNDHDLDRLNEALSRLLG